MTSLWMIDSYRARKWAYLAVPEIGDHIRYMSDGFDTVVKCVHRTHVCTTDGTVFRRRIDWALIAEIMARKVQRNVSEDAPEMRPLRPVTPYVRELVFIP